MNQKLEKFLDTIKLGDSLKKQEPAKEEKNILVWVLAGLGALAAIAAVSYAVYRYLTPDYLDDFEDFDDFDDFEDFDDDYSLDEDLEEE